MRGLFYFIVTLGALAIIGTSIPTALYWLAPNFYHELVGKRSELMMETVRASVLDPDADPEIVKILESDPAPLATIEDLVISERLGGKAVSLVFATPERVSKDGAIEFAEIVRLPRFCGERGDPCAFDQTPLYFGGFSFTYGLDSDFVFARNVVVMDSAANEAALVLPFTAIVQWAVLVELADQFGLLVGFSQEDTNGDDVLTGIDRRRLALYRFDDETLQVYDLPGSLMVAGPGVMPLETLPVTVMTDANGDGRYDFDIDPAQPFSLNLDSGETAPFIDQKTLGEAQALVGASAP